MAEATWPRGPVARTANVVGKSPVSCAYATYTVGGGAARKPAAFVFLKGQYDDCGEAGIPDEHPEGIPHVSSDLVEPAAMAIRADAFFGLFDAAPSHRSV